MMVEKMVVGTLMENCYIVADEQTREGVIVDPGDEPERIADRVNELGLKIDRLIATHGHVDHVGAVEPLKSLLKAGFHMHRADELFLDHINEAGMMYGMPGLENPTVDVYLKEGDLISFGGCQLKVIETPGHSPGGIILVGDGDAFVGDLVFAGSIGRVDLPGGDYAIMMHSLERKLLALANETRLHPGHGESTTLAVERKYNPFLKGLG